MTPFKAWLLSLALVAPSATCNAHQCMQDQLTDGLSLVQTSVSLYRQRGLADNNGKQLEVGHTSAENLEVTKANHTFPDLLKHQVALTIQPKHEWPRFPKMSHLLFLRFRKADNSTATVQGSKQDPTEVDSSSSVTIATPKEIGGIYFVIFVPVLLGWMLYVYSGMQYTVYVIMLPLSLIVCHVAFDIGNQSLSALMSNPMIITAVHATFLGVSTGIWSLMMERKEISGLPPWQLIRWTCTVSLLFAFYQCANHFVSLYCTLSERTVFLNLCPVMSLCMEWLFMPMHMKPAVNWSCKISLVAMAIGAILFSTQKSDFTTTGFIAASSLVITVIPYRMVQRYMVAVEMKLFPVAILCSLDGFMLLLPSSVWGGVIMNDWRTDMQMWFTSDSVLLLLFLTCIAFTFTHVLGLLMMQVGSATSYIVWANIANFTIVMVSVAFFGDNITENKIMFAGLLCSMLGGLWYSVESALSKEDKSQSSKDSEYDISKLKAAETQ